MLCWAHSNVIDFHKVVAHQDVHVKILDHKSFEGAFSAFAVERKARLAHGITWGQAICLVDRLGARRHTAAQMLDNSIGSCFR